MAALPPAALPPAALPPASVTRPRAIAGTCAVVLGLATGKWGAHLGIPPLFLTDVLLGLAVAALVAGRLLGRGAGATGPTGTWVASARGWPGAVCLVFVGYVCLRLAIRLDVSLTALRDFTPYGYAAVAFVAAWSYRASSVADRARTSRILQWALLTHLAWVIVVKLVPGLPGLMPTVDASQDLRLFSLRASTDATVIGITAAVYLIRALRDGRLRDISVVVASLAVVATTTPRAALLGTASALAIAVWLHYCGSGGQNGVRSSRRLLVAGFLPASLVLVGVLLPQTAPGQKLLVGFGLSTAETRADSGAIGTARGRTEAWNLVLDHVEETDSLLLGVGFGPDFLRESGALVPLGNGEQLRSPHNYLVGTYARIGLVGLVLLMMLLAVGIREIVRIRRFAGNDVLTSLVAIYPVAFFVSAVFGVELETPFGAVPFFWCLGILLSRPVGAAAAPPGEPLATRRSVSIGAGPARR